eukprot:XP_028337762.1 uncharacterized protein LOC114484616 [Physeter catodon]
MRVAKGESPRREKLRKRGGALVKEKRGGAAWARPEPSRPAPGRFRVGPYAGQTHLQSQRLGEFDSAGVRGAGLLPRDFKLNVSDNSRVSPAEILPGKVENKPRRIIQEIKGFCCSLRKSSGRRAYSPFSSWHGQGAFSSGRRGPMSSGSWRHALVSHWRRKSFPHRGRRDVSRQNAHAPQEGPHRRVHTACSLRGQGAVEDARSSLFGASWRPLLVSE